MLILRKAISFYFFINDDLCDPRSKTWPFMSTPFQVIGLIGLYLYFVNSWGPKFMKYREPFKLNTIIKIFNIMQIVVCSYLVYLGAFAYIKLNYNIICEPVDFSDDKGAVVIATGTYIYFLTKIFDLVDTVFFVLRKKQSQVTFLHVYHHSGMVFLSWVGSKYFPGGHSVFMGFINSFVHVVMYSYYLASSISPKYKKNLWWKKYITQLQLLQFLLLIIHFSILLIQPNCGYPRLPTLVLVPQNCFMFILFGDFYIKTYIRPKVIIKKELNGQAEINGINGLQENQLNINKEN